MAKSTKNVKLGVCNVFYDGLDLGFTQGGVEVSVDTETHKTEIDQFGKTAVTELIMGRNVKVKVPLAETTLRNLIATMPGSTLVTDGVQASGTITFSENPDAADTVTVGGQVFTFQATKATTAFQIMIGATQAATVAALVDVINRSGVQAAAGGVKATVNETGTVVTITANDAGTGGNAFTLAAAGTAPPVVSGATLAGGVAETKSRVDTTTGVGVNLLEIAKTLRLHPTGRAATDFTEDFVVYQAATAGALTFAYKVDAERVYNIEFTGYPDAAGKLFSVGDLLA